MFNFIVQKIIEPWNQTDSLEPSYIVLAKCKREILCIIIRY